MRMNEDFDSVIPVFTLDVNDGISLRSVIRVRWSL
jgi:hypothetical protein